MNMSNASLSLLAQVEMARGGWHYRHGRCCICRGSIDNFKGGHESSDDEETKEISKCTSINCGRIFHKKCLEEHFGSVGAKTCPGCQEKLQSRVVMITPKNRESTPSR